MTARSRCLLSTFVIEWICPCSVQTRSPWTQGGVGQLYRKDGMWEEWGVLNPDYLCLVLLCASSTHSPTVPLCMFGTITETRLTVMWPHNNGFPQFHWCVSVSPSMKQGIYFPYKMHHCKRRDICNLGGRLNNAGLSWSLGTEDKGAWLTSWAFLLKAWGCLTGRVFFKIY